jgi:hypothetical protein
MLWFLTVLCLLGARTSWSVFPIIRMQFLHFFMEGLNFPTGRGRELTGILCKLSGGSLKFWFLHYTKVCAYTLPLHFDGIWMYVQGGACWCRLFESNVYRPRGPWASSLSLFVVMRFCLPGGFGLCVATPSIIGQPYRPLDGHGLLVFKQVSARQAWHVRPKFE